MHHLTEPSFLHTSTSADAQADSKGLMMPDFNIMSKCFFPSASKPIGVLNILCFTGDALPVSILCFKAFKQQMSRSC